MKISGESSISLATLGWVLTVIVAIISFGYDTRSMASSALSKVTGQAKILNRIEKSLIRVEIKNGTLPKDYQNDLLPDDNEQD